MEPASHPDLYEAYKRMAAEQAVALIEPGMTVGLGTGSTAIWAIRRLASLLHSGQLHGITGFATSSAAWSEAQRLGIPLLAENLPRALDVTIDGADEVDPDLNLIKGGGGALLREKIAAQASHRVVIVVDESKPSPRLGTRRKLPVEVLPFGWNSQARFLAALGAQTHLRYADSGSLFKSEQGNLIVDCDFGPIADPAALAAQLAARAGIVEHGLFLGLATDLIVAGRDGVHHLVRPQ
jgi:ribose 5-phosphate isomerase A